MILNLHKHKKEYGIVVEEHEYFRPETDEKKFILIDTIEDCRTNIFIHLKIDVFIILSL